MCLPYKKNTNKQNFANSNRSRHKSALGIGICRRKKRNFSIFERFGFAGRVGKLLTGMHSRVTTVIQLVSVGGKKTHVKHRHLLTD